HTISDRDWSSDVCSSDLSGRKISADQHALQTEELIHKSLEANSNKPDPLALQLFGLQRVLVRADFPPGSGTPAPEGMVQLFPLGETNAPIAGRFFDFAPTTDPQTQSRGIFYVVENEQRQLAPGMSL